MRKKAEKLKGQKKPKMLKNQKVSKKAKTVVIVGVD